MTFKSNIFISAAIGALVVSGCGGGGSSSSSSNNSGSTTPPPVADTTAPSVSFSPTSLTIESAMTGESTLTATDSVGVTSGPTVTCTNGGSFSGSTFTAPTVTLDTTSVCTATAGDAAGNDGTATLTVSITAPLVANSGSLTCSSGESIDVLENTEGLIYTFSAEKKDAILQGVFFGPERSITRSGGESVPEEFNFSIIGYRNAENLRVAEFNLEISRYLNAETLGNLDNTFTITVQAEYEGEVTDCSVEIKVVDVENEVTSGVKLTGSYPDIFGFEHEEIGDIDGDGLTDFWVSSIRSRDDLPPDHEGHVIFGSKIESELRQVGPEEVLISELTASESVKIRGSFPSVFPGRRFIGNTLISHPIGDVDGDGRPELLLALSTPTYALESAFADRPLAYLIWSDALLVQTDGLIDLNNLLPSEGLALEGLGGIDRRGNTAISGDFDGDGIDDIVVRIPSGEIAASDTTAYRGQTFFIFGDFLRASKGSSSIDLLDDVDDIDSSKIVLLTTESTTLNTPQPTVERAFLLNGEVRSLSDIDGDGADELIGSATIGQFARSVGVLSSNLIKSAKGQNGLILMRDIPDEGVDTIEGFEYVIVSNRNGDFDGDGLDDLLFLSRDGYQSKAPATLFKGQAIQANTSSSLIENTPTEGIINFVSSNDIEEIFDVSFIPDVDGDSRDDIVLSYTNIITIDEEFESGEFESVDFESIDKVVLVLAKALDGHPTGEAFNLDSMSAGDGLHFTNSSIRRLGSVFSTLSDVDGDDIPDLLISPSINGPVLRREAFLIPGSDIRTALNSSSTLFDLEDRFRTSPE